MMNGLRAPTGSGKWTSSDDPSKDRDIEITYETSSKFGSSGTLIKVATILLLVLFIFSKPEPHTVCKPDAMSPNVFY